MTDSIEQAPRARGLGIPFDGTPGPLDAITDVSGVAVGHSTIVSDDEQVARTGVTAVLPRGLSADPVFAATHVLNGNGELTGTAWIRESGFLEGPVLLTNTHSVGVVRDAAAAWMMARALVRPHADGHFWLMPVVGETYDGYLNEINGFHVTPRHALQALEQAAPGRVPEGNVGGGTGMICHDFKGGIGTASRIVSIAGQPGGFTLGVLLQANHGRRADLRIAGRPIGREITDLMPELASGPRDSEAGSVIVVVATDAALLPHQLERLARRVPLGLARTGCFGANGSGDLFLAFSTANPGAGDRVGRASLQMLPNDLLDPLFEATVQAVEEAVVNALVAARTMTGIAGNVAHAIPHARLREAFGRADRT